MQTRGLEAIPQRGRDHPTLFTGFRILPNAVAVLQHKRIKDVLCGFFVSLKNMTSSISSRKSEVGANSPED